MRGSNNKSSLTPFKQLGRKNGRMAIVMKLLSIFFCCFFFLLTGCKEAPLKIGILAPLTGPFSHVGVSARNAIQMAVDEINTAGGIDGRLIQLEPENTIGTPEELHAAAARLADQEAVAIIGPIMSQKAIQLRPFIKGFDGAIISPMVATEQLSGLKDNFFRTMATTDRRAKMLANYIIDKRLIKSVLIFGDLNNAAYVESFNDAFERALTERNGIVTARIEKPLSQEKDAEAIFKSLEEKPADAILISASAINVAAIAQKLRQSGNNIQILAPTWPFQKQIITAGGRDIEGSIFASSFNPVSDYPPYQAFVTRFLKRFGDSGSPGKGVYAYEAAKLLFQALKKSRGDKAKTIKILSQKPSIDGLYGQIFLDEFGDVNRKDFLMTIKNGAFAALTDVN